MKIHALMLIAMLSLSCGRDHRHAVVAPACLVPCVDEDASRPTICFDHDPTFEEVQALHLCWVGGKCLRDCDSDGGSQP